ncbi:hypothetical protein AB1L30_21315 [Bremerella sp. JC817]|uniref:hypothetical protein n=1 Tax=Bremerella sp. JC817 TaxID=3231756 RepID=UPI003458F2C2
MNQVVDWDDVETDAEEYMFGAPFLFGRFVYRVGRGFFLRPRTYGERVAQLALLPIVAFGVLFVYGLVTLPLPYWAQGIACLFFLVYFCGLAWTAVTLSHRYEEEIEQREEF